MDKFVVSLIAAILVALVDFSWGRFVEEKGLGQQSDHFLEHAYKAEEYFSQLSDDQNASQTTPEKYITAGSPTGLAQYPWVVYLTIKIRRWMGIQMSSCGGSLVSPRHVLTAAHCVDFQIRTLNDVNIHLAEYNTRTFPTDCVGRQCTRNIVMHPDKITIHGGYRRGGLGRVVQNDIALLRLRGSAPNTDYIRPIRLPAFNINHPKYEGTPVIVTGWGHTEYGQPSSIKLHAQVRLVAPNTCRRYAPVTAGILCAASRSGQGVCFGDSGGPMVVAQGGDYHLVGIMSFIIDKCGSPLPSMYTNVYPYLGWIRNYMRD